METITKTVEFCDACLNHWESSPAGNKQYNIVESAFFAGGEAAQAILQPEINRLREVVTELIAVALARQNSLRIKQMDAASETGEKVYSKAIADIGAILNKANAALAEGLNN